MSTASERVGLRRMLAVVDLLIDAVDEDSLVPALLPTLLRAVPGDSVAWGSHPASAGRLLTWPRDLLDERTRAAFARDRVTDPLVAYTTYGCGEPLRRSELQTAGQFHALAAYADVYGPIGAEHQLAMAFPAGYAGGVPRRVCVAVNRSGNGGAGEFTDDDVRSAALLRTRLSHAMNRLAPPPFAPDVTDRESAILDLLAHGLTDRQIARRLAISPRTVDKHLEHAYRKLRVNGRVDAVNAWRARPHARPIADG